MKQVELLYFLKSNITDSKGNYLGSLDKKLLPNNKAILSRLVINYGKSEEGFLLAYEKIKQLRKDIYFSGFLYTKDNFRTDAFNDFDDGSKIYLDFYIVSNKFINYFSTGTDLFINQKGDTGSNKVYVDKMIHFSGDMNYHKSEDIGEEDIQHDEVVNKSDIDFDSTVQLPGSIYYYKDNFKFYDSNGELILDILKKRGGGPKDSSKPLFYDKIMIILFMYLYENAVRIDNNNVIVHIGNKGYFEDGLNYIKNKSLLKSHDIDVDIYRDYFFKDLEKRIDSLVHILNNGLKTSIFKCYPTGVQIK